MDWQALFLENWPVKLVSAVLIWAAWIDGRQLRVPNWQTFPMVISGLVYNAWAGGWSGLGDGLLGMVVGLLTLMPLYSVGGMGAGDVKLMAGIGAWLGAAITFNAFLWTTVIGAVMAVAMIWWQNGFAKHTLQALVIWTEWTSIRNPVKLAEIAKERKPRMLLLPYGIPICVGSIAYFFYAGLY